MVTLDNEGDDATVKVSTAPTFDSGPPDISQNGAPPTQLIPGDHRSVDHYLPASARPKRRSLMSAADCMKRRHRVPARSGDLQHYLLRRSAVDASVGRTLCGNSVFFSATLGLFSVCSLFVWRRTKEPITTQKPCSAATARSRCSPGDRSDLSRPIFSTALAITLGIGFFGQSSDHRGAWFICGSAIILSMLVLGAVWMGLFTDIGVFRNSAAGSVGMAFMTLMVPMVLLVTLFQARWSSQAIEEAMGSAVTAAMDVNLKKVQLEEAQAELERIFGAGGLPGRLTGESIGGYRLGPLLGRGASGEVYDGVDQAKDSSRSEAAE